MKIGPHINVGDKVLIKMWKEYGVVTSIQKDLFSDQRAYRVKLSTNPSPLRAWDFRYEELSLDISPESIFKEILCSK